MKNKKLLFWSFINSAVCFLYVLGIGWFLFNGENIFGKADNFLMPVALLLLLVVSATITGALILGRPILFYLNGYKSEAVKLLLFTIGWLIIFTVIILLLNL
ncbi:MAG: hypothetical protein PHG69_06285 [Candidatus Omnitrophica bacterium]|nr:hypothetical protein [Candidatus Omnitrophota bacterium]